MSLQAWFPTLALAASLALSGCGAGGGTDPGRDPGGAESGRSPVKATLVLGKVGVLSKSAAVDLRKLVLTAISESTPPDTLRDTLAVSGLEAQTVRRTLALRHTRRWILRARTLDARDSAIHEGQTLSFLVKPLDTAEVSLSLASRFTMYQAQFQDLPTRVGSEGGQQVGINLNRVLLRIDGAVRADSTLPSGRWFQPGQSVTLAYDYVTPGSHAVALEAYGLIEGYYGLLFSGTATLALAPGQDASQPITLKWVGPSTGAAPVTVILGRVGKALLVGGFSPVL